MLKRLIPTSVLVVLVLLPASGANAFTSDKRTYFTFSQSVALPGVTLPAGTYMFRLADDTTSRKVIQVASKDGTQSYAMLHTMPAYRPDAPRDPEVRFMETAAGQPIAVRAWWMAGERTGYEFLYSKEQLARLNSAVASAAAAPAPEFEPAGEPVADVGEGPVSAPNVIDGDGLPPEGVEVETETDVEFQRAQAEVPQQQGVPPARTEPSPDSAAASRNELPQTASPLALLLLGGAVSATLGLRMMRKS